MKQYIFSLLFVVTLISCSDNKTDNIDTYSFGECNYYPSFLWSDENVEYIDKTIVLDFNQDAKSEGSFAVLQFVDKESKPLDMSEYEILIDNQPLSSPEFKATCNQDSVKLQIRSLPTTDSGVKTGYMKIKSGHTIDRVGQTPLESSDTEAIILQWQFDYNKHWNPWLLALTWIGIIIAVLCLIWLLIIKKMKYPTFKKGIITISNPYYSSIKVRGARMVIFTPTKKVQSWLNKLVTGRIIYHVHPEWTCEVQITPSGKSNMRFRCPNNILVSDPSMIWSKGNEYKIIESQTGKKIIELNIQ